MARDMARQFELQPGHQRAVAANPREDRLRLAPRVVSGLGEHHADCPPAPVLDQDRLTELDVGRRLGRVVSERLATSRPDGIHRHLEVATQ